MSDDEQPPSTDEVVPSAPAPDTSLPSYDEVAAPKEEFVRYDRLAREVARKNEYKRQASEQQERIAKLETELDAARPRLDIPKFEDSPIENIKMRLDVALAAIDHLARENTGKADEARQHAYLVAQKDEAAAELGGDGDLDEAARHAFNARVQAYSYLGREQAILAATGDQKKMIQDCARLGKNPWLVARDIALATGFQPRRKVDQSVSRQRAIKETAGLPVGGKAADDPYSDAQTSAKSYAVAKARFMSEHPGASDADWYKKVNKK